MPDFTLDYLAVIRIPAWNSMPMYRLDYLNTNKKNKDWSKESKWLLSNPNLDRVIICYKTVINKDFKDVRLQLERAEISPDDITDLLP